MTEYVDDFLMLDSITCGLCGPCGSDFSQTTANEQRRVRSGIFPYFKRGMWDTGYDVRRDTRYDMRLDTTIRKHAYEIRVPENQLISGICVCICSMHRICCLLVSKSSWNTAYVCAVPSNGPRYGSYQVYRARSELKMGDTFLNNDGCLNQPIQCNTLHIQ